MLTVAFMHCAHNTWNYSYLQSITPDFWTSLEKGTPEFQTLYENKIKKETNYKEILDELAVLYEKNNLTKKEIGSQLRIPKKIHQIWLGSPLPERYKQWQKTWTDLHPDWEYTLWTDADIPSLTMQNKKLFLASKNLAERSEIVRCEILYQYGGVYIDTNIECLKPFDIFHYAYDFYVGILPLENEETLLTNGLIGSAPGHPALKMYLDSLQTRWCYPIIENQIQYRSGALAFEQAVFQALTTYSPEIIALPPSFFFTAKDNVTVNTPEYLKNYYKFSRCKPETFAISHEDGSWNKEKNKIKDKPLSSNREEKHIVVVIPSYNNVQWYKRNLLSIFLQKYNNYSIIYTDDCSTDGTAALVEAFIKQHKQEHRTTIIR
ncbi:MAG: glycosyltransferase, partial [Hydrogenophaga sp.]|nr:glycosyltransferase [Hydrogenophaga sp.]